MKTTTHGSLHPVATKSEEHAKPDQDSEKVEPTVWVLIAVFAALVLAFVYLFLKKF